MVDHHLISRRDAVRGVLGAAGAVITAGTLHRVTGDRVVAPTLATDSADLPSAADHLRPSLPTIEPRVRVRVARVRGLEPTATIRLGEPGVWIRMVREPVHADGEPSGHRAMHGTLVQSPVAVSITAQGWSITDARGFRPWVEAHEPLRFLCAAKTTSPVLRLGERSFTGTLRLVARHTPAHASEQGVYDVVNELPMESYVPGVIARELFEHWHVETFCAQAIAARSFALCECEHWRGRRHFDLTDTTQSQVYGGATGLDVAQRAVDITRHQYLLYADRVVPAYYSACCGGHAARAAHAIGPNPVNAIEPLHGQVEIDSCTEWPVHRWERVRSRDVIAAQLREYGGTTGVDALREAGLVESIGVDHINANGRPERYRIVTPDAVTIIESTDLRRALSARVPDLASIESLPSSHLTVHLGRDASLIEGRGLGHGVGLCQYGAEAFARRGATWPEILAWYYPGASIGVSAIEPSLG